MHIIQQHFGWEGTPYKLAELGKDGKSLLLHLKCGSTYLDLHEATICGKITASELQQRIRLLPNISKSQAD